MTDKRPRDQGKKTSKSLSFTEDVMEVVKTGDMHSYTNSEGGVGPRPDSAPCTPDAKKGKTEPTLSELQDNIVRLVAEKIKENADNLAGLIKKNADTIEALKESTEFLFNEVQDMKKEMTTVKKANDDHQKKITGLEDRWNEMERYHRRWNLRLYGLPEQEGEDVKQRMIEICKAVLQDPEEDLQVHIDVSYRIGRRENGKKSTGVYKVCIQINQRKGMEIGKEFGIPQNKKVKIR